MTTQEEQITKEIETDPELREQLKKLVLARAQVMPDTLGISVGSNKLSREDLVKHIEQEDEVGKQMMEMELEFLRDLASGAVYSHE